MEKTNDTLLTEWLKTNEIKKLRTFTYKRPEKLTGVKTKPLKNKRVKNPKKKPIKSFTYRDWFKTNFKTMIGELHRQDEFFKQINKVVNIPLFNREYRYVVELIEPSETKTQAVQENLTYTKKRRKQWYKKSLFLVLEVVIFNNDSLKQAVNKIKDLTNKT